MALWSSNPTNASSGTSERAGCFATLSVPTATTTTLADTWYPIGGTFTNDPCVNFSAATTYTPGIKYDGVMTKDFIVAGQFSFQVTTNATTVGVGFKKNNSFLDASQICVYARYNDQCYLLVGSCHVELEPTDEIQMVIKSTRDAEEITLEQFNLHIRPFFN